MYNYTDHQRTAAVMCILYRLAKDSGGHVYNYTDRQRTAAVMCIIIQTGKGQRRSCV